MSTQYRPTQINEFYGGEQRIYEFPNGYGASVVRNKTSAGGKLGLFELAVLGKDGHIITTTPVTPRSAGVVGFLNESDVQKTLHKVAGLKPADLSVKELADEIGMHPVRATDLVRRGYFPNAYKSGRGRRNSPWRIPADDVATYKKKQPRAPKRVA